MAERLGDRFAAEVAAAADPTPPPAAEAAAKAAPDLLAAADRLAQSAREIRGLRGNALQATVDGESIFINPHRALDILDALAAYDAARRGGGG